MLAYAYALFTVPFELVVCGVGDLRNQMDNRRKNTELKTSENFCHILRRILHANWT